MSELVLGLLLPVIGTTVGAGFVFFIKDKIPGYVEKALLGFASGVMIAASVWSLLIPSMNMVGGEGVMTVVPAAVGFLLGMGFLLLLDMVTPHLHLGSKSPEGIRAKLSRTTMLTFAVALHNLPEGMAVGVVYAGAIATGGDVAVSSALALSVGIAIQNLPEGAIVSMPLYAENKSKLKSFGIGALTGLVEPVGAVMVILLASLVTWILPYLLAFAAGAMIYVVIEELIPEASQGEHSNVSTVGFALGFTLMMVLDVVLG